MKSIYAGAVVCVSVAVACALGARAEERTVSTAADLVAALEALNSNTAPAEPNVIYLEPGSYDVSAYSMANWGSSGKTSTFFHSLNNPLTKVWYHVGVFWYN